MVRVPLVLALVAALAADVGLPALAAWWAVRHLHVAWRVLGYGMLTFVVAGLVGLMPLIEWANGLAAKRSYVSTPVGLLGWILVLALVTALVEQAGRYLGLRLLFSDLRRTWARAVVFGLGYGGLRAVFWVALPAVVSLGNAILLPQLDPYSLRLSYREALNLRAMQAEIASLEVWRPLLASVESGVTVLLQTGLAVLVLQTFSRLQWRWLLYAGLLHTMGQASVLLGAAYEQPGWGLLGLTVAAAVVAYWAVRLRPQALPSTSR